MSTRQLSVILFADIANYTALMQLNEQKALSIIKHFRETLQQTVPTYQGSIIQFYGDGCLMIFQSSVNAIKCAMQLQQTVKNPPHVPLRIGVHQGDIIIEGGNIFGDSVNIAARIESMSVPGAILISKHIQAQLKNKSEFQLSSLGSFDFKNVENPLEVFAIANEGFPVPERHQLKGKFKETNKEKSIAVLAFENRSPDPEQEYFSDGIAEEIIYGLSQINNLKVAGRASSFSFKGKNVPFKDIAKQLSVKHILEGSVRKMGNRVRVTVQLVNATNGFQLWTDRFDKELSDIFAIQDEIAQNVVQKLELTLLLNEKARPIIRTQTDEVKAYQLNLQGRHFLDQRSNIDAAFTCFNRAIDISPMYAPAHVGMAFTQFYQPIFNDHAPFEAFPKGKASIKKALEIDSSIAEAHTVDGIFSFYYDRDWKMALRKYEDALVLAPNHFETYRVKAYYHSMMCETAEAEKLARKAADMEPLSFNAKLSLGEILYRSKKYSEAIESFQQILEVYPDNYMALYFLEICYHLMEKFEAAKKISERLRSIPFKSTYYASLRFALAAELGDDTKAQQYLNFLQENVKNSRWVSPSSLALLHFSLGNEEEAGNHLQKAYETYDPGLLIGNIDPIWEKYKQTTHMQEMLRKLDLSQASALNL